jgi:hypothetical protein
MQIQGFARPFGFSVSSVHTSISTHFIIVNLGFLRLDKQQSTGTSLLNRWLMTLLSVNS